MNTMYDEPCDCGMCGLCREQLEYERQTDKAGWHTPPAKEACHWSCTGCDSCGSSGHGQGWF